MTRIRSMLFGIAITAALGSGVQAARAEPLKETMRLCGKEPGEGSCASCCAYYGLSYYWSESFGCACGT